MIFSMVRRDCFNHELLPGDYRALARDPLAWVTMRCLDCHKLSQLLRRVHTIDVFGNVTPECVCPSCNSQREIYLLDWVPEAKGQS